MTSVDFSAMQFASFRTCLKRCKLQDFSENIQRFQKIIIKKIRASIKTVIKSHSEVTGLLEVSDETKMTELCLGHEKWS